MPVHRAEKAMILARLERLHTLLNQLDKTTTNPGAHKKVCAHIRRELKAAKKAVRTLTTLEPA